MKKREKDMTYKQQTRTACLCRHGRQASRKSAECQPPPWYEQLRRDNEKLTEIFEFARREFEKKDEEIETLKSELTQMRAEMKKLKEENATLKKQLKEEKAKVALLNRMLFGKKTEKQTNHARGRTRGKERKDNKKNTKKRGAKSGHNGRGRKIPKNLPKREEKIDIPDDEKFCPKCGLPYEDLGSEECSSEVGVENEYYIKVFKRKKYRKTCSCSKPIAGRAGPGKTYPEGQISP
jgi:DNA repair exonuclease SbcCD ATPase subunit